MMLLARTVLLAAALVAAAGCDSDAPPGMPPASEWKPPAPRPSKAEGARRGGKRGARGSASHRLDVEAKDKGAGMAAEQEGGGAGDDGASEEDPHGPDPGHGEEAAEEAEEVEAGPRETLVRGQIRAAGDAAAAIKPGAILYVSAVPIDPDSGQPKGTAVAVDRFEVTSLPMKFELAAAPYKGDVMISAWTDADGEARTREPGDAEGRVRARLPAERVDLVLDKVLK
jgi:hypothetical protein